MSESGWASAEGFAAAAIISDRKARQALARAINGLPWRGHLLEVRTVHGRGGRRDMAYEVSLKSLSEALQQPLPDDFSDAIPPEVDRLLSKACAPRPSATNQDDAVNRRLAAIRTILNHPAGSPERAAATLAAVKPDQSARSLQRWTEAYEAEGLAGLANRRPTNAGQARAVVSRTFNRMFLAAGYTPTSWRRSGRRWRPRSRACGRAGRRRRAGAPSSATPGA